MDICCVNRFVAAFHGLEFPKVRGKREPSEPTAFLDSRDLRFYCQKIRSESAKLDFPPHFEKAVQQR